jgi:hypothetical protein
MRKLWVAGLCALCLGTIGSGVAVAADDTIVLRAKLSGFNEVPPISGTGAGTFKATIHADGSIDFTLVYENLTGIPAQAHIHFAQPAVNGNVMIFLCGGPKPACPAAVSGTVTGTISAADVLAVPAQGITAGDLAAALRAIGHGEGYANMHTPNHPAGEIRGQLSVERDDD